MISCLTDCINRLTSTAAEPTPYTVVYTENKLRLRYYEARAERQEQAIPVVFAYALINTPAVLDLSRDRSVVGQFLDRGFDVYLIDWGKPSRLDAPLSFSDYVVRYLDNCVDIARERSGTDGVHIVGYSTIAPLSAVYAALFPEKVAALGLQGPPLDFDVEGGMFDLREIAERHDPQRLVDTFGTIPAELLDLGFSLRKPIEYTVGKPLRGMEHLGDEEYVERAARIARWAFDGADMAGETYRQFIEELLMENKLIENRLTLMGRRVDLENIVMPVALILGAEDAFIPHAASRPFLDAVPSDDTTVFEFPTGHIGTLVGEAAHAAWWLTVCTWFERQCS